MAKGENAGYMCLGLLFTITHISSLSHNAFKRHLPKNQQYFINIAAASAPIHAILELF